MSGRKTRKLLTAAVGVATVSYVVGCGRTATGLDGEGRQLSGDESTAGDPSNRPVATSDDSFDPGDQTVISGNLVAPPPTDYTIVVPQDSATISGNLIAPPDYTIDVDDTTQAPSESSFIAGNLLPPPSNWPNGTEPPAVTDTIEPSTIEPSTEPPAVTDTAWTDGPDTTVGPGVTGVVTSDGPVTSDPPVVSGSVDAGVQDASVSDEQGGS